MGNKFKTVEEVIHWINFAVNDEIYDLSHLNAHWAEYFDNRDVNKPITYKFIVTYSFHCFTQASKKLTDEESQLLMYHAPRESRPFDFERYYLSKQLPSMICDLGHQKTIVFHAAHGKYATFKVVDSRGIEVDYFVVFRAFRESKKLRLHVQSAYPKYEGIGRIKKVKFFTIAKNLLRNKKLPKP